MGMMHNATQQENIRKAKELWDSRRADKMARSKAQNVATSERKAMEKATFDEKGARRK